MKKKERNGKRIGDRREEGRVKGEEEIRGGKKKGGEKKEVQKREIRREEKKESD